MKKGRFLSRYIVSSTYLKENTFIGKMHWLAQGKTRGHQHRIKRSLF